MKTLISKTILASVFVTVFSLATSAVFANDEKNPVKTELFYVGNIKNKPVFKLNLDNADGQEFTVLIRDEQNNVLYRHSGKDNVFTKKFMLSTEDVSVYNLRFEIIIGNNTAKPIVYEVNRSTRFVDEMMVNKVN